MISSVSVQAPAANAQPYDVIVNRLLTEAIMLAERHDWAGYLNKRMAIRIMLEANKTTLVDFLERTGQ